MSNKINILFLGGAKRVSLAESFIAYGKSIDKDVAIFSYELDKYVPIASVAEIIIGLKWNDDKIFDHLSETIAKNNIHIVLPFVDSSTIISAKLKSRMQNVFIPVSDEHTCNILFDKILANDWFKQNNIPLPTDDGKFPLIAKPSKGSASKGLVIIRSQEELDHFKSNYNVNNYLLQKYLIADEYSVDAYVSISGEAISIVPRKRLEVSSGEVTKSITIKDIEIINVSKQIISSLNFQGPITLQFLREKETNRLSIMEINPRFGGGVVTSIHAGADSCSVIIKEYLNQPVSVVDDWKENLIMTRAFREFYYYANNN